MQIELVNHYLFEDKTEFKGSTVKRQLDILLMVIDGSCSILPENKDKPYIVGKNEIFFIPANTEFKREIISALTYYHISFYAQADHPFRISLPVGKIILPPEQTLAIFNSMHRAAHMPDNRELISHIVEHILAEDYLFSKKRKKELNHLSDEVLNTINYMNKNLSKKIDIDDLAARVYLSNSGLAWKFKQELNTTPSQYLIMLRLRYAKQLLLNHDYTVTKISEMCGYSNPYYFTNVFHNYCGMSPTDFRKHYLKGAQK